MLYETSAPDVTVSLVTRLRSDGPTPRSRSLAGRTRHAALFGVAAPALRHMAGRAGLIRRQPDLAQY